MKKIININNKQIECDIEDASYLPMPLTDFESVFDIPITSGEITHATTTIIEGVRCVTGYIMNTKYYTNKDLL